MEPNPKPAASAAAMKKSGKDSGRNSPADDNDEEAKDDPSITLGILGDANCPVSPDDTEIEYCMIYNIGKIQGLEKCTKLRRLGLRKNRIKKIEGLDCTPILEELELYDNLVSRLEGLDHVPKLQVLDLSFNKLKKLENLHNLPALRKLFASSNRIHAVSDIGLTAVDRGTGQASRPATA